MALLNTSSASFFKGDHYHGVDGVRVSPLPEASSGSFRLNGHVAGATDARGTAGTRDG